MKEMNASDFKANCLAILDEVAATGEEITILKHGKPIARLVAAPRGDGGYPQDSLKGTVHIVGDIIRPALDPAD
jgi:prevent-host-death family protein